MYDAVTWFHGSTQSQLVLLRDSVFKSV